MKKNLFLLIFFLVTFFIAGCGEQEKYNTTKNEFIQIQQEWESLKPSNKNVDKRNDLAKKLDEKIAIMESLAKSETTLNNDLLAIKKEYKTKTDDWNKRLKVVNDFEKAAQAAKDITNKQSNQVTTTSEFYRSANEKGWQ